MMLAFGSKLRVALWMSAAVFLGAGTMMAEPIMGNSPEGRMILAQNSGKKKKNAKKSDDPKVRKRTLVGEKKFQVKKGERTNLDFEAADISGQRRDPMGSIVDTIQSDKDYDFVKVRLRWTPEMVQSASSLETGSSEK